MVAEVEVGTRMYALELLEPEREAELDVGRGVGIVGELLMVVETVVVLAHSERHMPLHAVLLPLAEPFHFGAGPYEELHFHLLELPHAEDELAGDDLVAESLSYLGYSERYLHPARLLHVDVVDEYALCRLGTQVHYVGIVADGAEPCREHQVELPHVGPVLGAAYGAYDAAVEDNLPVFGTFYGKKANLNKEALMAAAPDVVIDMGEIKGSKEAMIADLDKLQDDILIPVIFIEAYLENTPEVYRTVGKLLGEEEKCEKLAVFAEEAINMAAEARTKIKDPVAVYYSSSADGLQAIPEGNFHGEVIEKIGAENAVKASLGASAAEISLEELYMSDPDVILLTEQDAYDEVTTNPLWSPLSAVINNRVYLIPSEPYPFIDNPPATNRVIGIYWLGNLLYPELYPINIIEETKEFYSLYYNHELTNEDAARILGL